MLQVCIVTGSRRQVNDGRREKTTTHRDKRWQSKQTRTSKTQYRPQTAESSQRSQTVHPDWFWLRFQGQTETSSTSETQSESYSAVFSMLISRESSLMEKFLSGKLRWLHWLSSLVAFTADWFDHTTYFYMYAIIYRGENDLSVFMDRNSRCFRFLFWGQQDLINAGDSSPQYI